MSKYSKRLHQVTLIKAGNGAQPLNTLSLTPLTTPPFGTHVARSVRPRCLQFMRGTAEVLSLAEELLLRPDSLVELWWSD